MHTFYQIPAFLRKFRPDQWSLFYRAAIVFVLMAVVFGLHYSIHQIIGDSTHALLFLPVIAGGLLFGFPGGIAASLIEISVDVFIFHIPGQSMVDYLHQGAATDHFFLFVGGIAAGAIGRLWISLYHELDHRATVELSLRSSQQMHEQLASTAQRQAMQLSLLDQVHTALAGEIDLKTLYRLVCESTANSFHYPLVSLYLVQGDSLVLEYQVGYDSVFPEIPLGKGVMSRCVSSGKPILLTEVATDPDFLRASPQITSEVSVPIREGTRVIGVFNIESSIDMPLTEADLRLMIQISQYLNLAVTRARLYEDEREERLLAEALYDTARAVNASLNFEEVLANILTNLDRIVECEAVGMLLIEENSSAMYVQRQGDPTPRKVNLPAHVSVPEIHFLQSMAASRQPKILVDTSQEPFFCESDSMKWMLSAIGVPILIQSKVAGFLILGSTQLNYFTAVQANRLQIFGQQAATALQNARLFSDANLRARYLTALNEITSLALSTSDPDQIFQGLADGLAHLIGADSTYITRWDATRQIAIPVASYGPRRKEYAGINPEQGEATVTAAVLQMGQTLVVEDAQSSPFLSPRIAAQFPIRSMLAIPLIADGVKLGAILLAFEKAHVFAPEEVALCEQASAQVSLAITKIQLISRIEQLAITDDLTGLYNHRGILEFGRREVERAQRFGRPLAAIMIDLDHFKDVNDQFGHLLGNQTLKVMSDRCRANVREIDIFGRYGGEEFLVLLPENTLEDARMVAERLRSIISGLAIHTANGAIHITASLGVAVLDANVADLAGLIERADQALYQAKNMGRNCVAVNRG